MISNNSESLYRPEYHVETSLNSQCYHQRKISKALNKEKLTSRKQTHLELIESIWPRARTPPIYLRKKTIRRRVLQRERRARKKVYCTKWWRLRAASAAYTRRAIPTSRQGIYSWAREREKERETEYKSPARGRCARTRALADMSEHYPLAGDGCCRCRRCIALSLFLTRTYIRFDRSFRRDFSRTSNRLASDGFLSLSSPPDGKRGSSRIFTIFQNILWWTTEDSIRGYTFYFCCSPCVEKHATMLLEER